MFILVQPAAELPIYRQIMRQVVDLIASGRLAPGSRLPSHRELSEQLVVAPLTVKRAYDELEAQGYIVTHRGRGTFVGTRTRAHATAAQTAALADAADMLLARGIAAGLSFDDVVTLLRDADARRPHSPAGKAAKDS